MAAGYSQTLNDNLVRFDQLTTLVATIERSWPRCEATDLALESVQGELRTLESLITVALETRRQHSGWPP